MPKPPVFHRPGQQTEFRTLGLDLCLEDDPPPSANPAFVVIASVIKDAYLAIKALPVTFVPGPHITGFGAFRSSPTVVVSCCFVLRGFFLFPFRHAP
jgi:hypothetical protein